MTAQARNHATGDKQHQIAQGAALIANFYGRRGQLHQLQDRLVQGLDLSHHDREGGYSNTANNAFLLHFDSPVASAHDTSIIQLALNRSGPVEKAWKGMREQLEQVVPDDSALSAVWGYTLIYQAELVEESISAPAHNELLLTADLIAHKGYHQIRQYRLGDLIGQYRQQMDTLLKQAENSMENPAKATKAAAKLDDLGRGYSSLVIASVHLNALRVSLIRQANDFSWWCKQVGDDDIVTFHQHHLEVACQELTLQLDEGQHPLDAAKMAVDVMRASLDQEQERKQQRIEAFLATAAAALSALALFDKEAVSGLLGLVGIPQPVGILPLLGVQVCCMVVVALLAMLVIRVIRARHLR